MADPQKALETQIKNIEARTGLTLNELMSKVSHSGLAKHSEVVAMLKSELSLGHGDANTIAHLAKQAAAPAMVDEDEPLDTLYTDKKAALRPIHAALLAQLEQLGTFEVAPKQQYVSYRRKKQFLMIGPGTNTRIDLGLNIKNLPSSPRLEEMPVGRMCNYRVKLTSIDEVDGELIAWVSAAYDAAG